MKASANIVCDSSGNTPPMHLQGRGFIVLPGAGAVQGSFPLTVAPHSVKGTPAIPLTGPLALYTEPFHALEFQGGTPNGNYVLYVFDNEKEAVDAAGLLGVGWRVFTAAQVQTYNSTNAPDNLVGVSLIGCDAWHAIIEAPLGATITAAQGWQWYYDPELAVWIPTQRQIDIGGLSQRREKTIEFESLIPGGRGYLEIRTGTHSGGSGAFNVYFRARRKS